MTFVFRNNTIERFFSNGEYAFSGYDDYGAVPEAERYIWWYQVPVKYNQEQLITEVESYLRRLQWAVSQVGQAPFLILSLELLYDAGVVRGDRRLVNAIDAFNQGAWQLAAEHTNVSVVDFGAFLKQYPAAEWVDWKFYFLSQMIVSPRLAGAFGQWLQTQERALAFRRKKCLVLDLDNTLWGGVLGEDGIAGIRIDGDYPGKAFRYWQEAIRELAHAGVILALCSKNNEADVKELFAAREMPLKWEDFACMRINWSDKAANIRSIAEDLNIGLDSMVFVDDNPAERELIRQQLPMVAVPEWPAMPYLLPAFYDRLVKDYFAVYALTDEDLKKTEQYRQNAGRAQAQAAFTDMDDFLRSLEMELTISPATEVTLPRIAQMTQKTNQFNLTTHRYTVDDIQRMLDHGARIWTLAVKDRFGDNGITGLIIVTDCGAVDTMLLSCRVLGKGIEHEFLKYVLGQLKASGLEEVHALYIPTEKNRQVQDFYDKNGFLCTREEQGRKAYRLSLADWDEKRNTIYKIV